MNVCVIPRLKPMWISRVFAESPPSPIPTLPHSTLPRRLLLFPLQSSRHTTFVYSLKYQLVHVRMILVLVEKTLPGVLRNPGLKLNQQFKSTRTVVKQKFSTIQGVPKKLPFWKFLRTNPYDILGPAGPLIWTTLQC